MAIFFSRPLTLTINSFDMRNYLTPRVRPRARATNEGARGRRGIRSCVTMRCGAGGRVKENGARGRAVGSLAASREWSGASPCVRASAAGEGRAPHKAGKRLKLSTGNSEGAAVRVSGARGATSVARVVPGARRKTSARAKGEPGASARNFAQPSSQTVAAWRFYLSASPRWLAAEAALETSQQRSTPASASAMQNFCPDHHVRNIPDASRAPAAPRKHSVGRDGGCIAESVLKGEQSRA